MRTEVVTGSISSNEVCSLLHGNSPTLSLPTKVVSDNASHQRTAAVREQADHLNIELLCLPPYPPNLNLTERVWERVRKLDLAARVLPNLSDFRDSIIETVNSLETTNNQDVATIMTLSFQHFTQVECRSE